MLCQKTYSKGFTIVELIVVIAVFAVFMGISQLGIMDYRVRGDVQTAAYNVVEALRHAKANAEQVQDDSKWGVQINANQVIVFEGNSYATRNTNYDQVVTLPQGVTMGGLSEIVFEKVNGTTLNLGSITLTNNATVNTITINAKGTITY